MPIVRKSISAMLKHVAGDGRFPWTLMEGAKGVQLAELGLRSWRERRWLDVPDVRWQTSAMLALPIGVVRS